MIGTFHIVAFGLYAVAAAMLALSLARGSRQLTTAASVLVALGLASHAFALVDYAAVRSQLPLVGLGPSLSSLAFLIGVGCLIAVTFGQVWSIAIFLVPLVALLTGLALLVGLDPAGEALAWRGGWFVLHVVFAFIGFSGLAVAFAAGLTYLLQFRQLKSKHFGAIFRFFPPLDTLDKLGRLGLLVGFPFLTLAMLLGWAWTENFGGPGELGNPKLVWVLMSWLVFLAALLAGSGKGRKGERGALASVIGFVVVVVLYVIVRTQEAGHGSFL
jgi:ABC-type uncharacterized transport system permease subunit